MDNLSRLAAQAREQGLSYGKYMALRKELGKETPHTVQKELTKPEEPERMCVICGKLLMPGMKGRAMTCGPSCSYELTKRRSRERYRRLHPKDLTELPLCLRCNQPYTPKRAGTRFCCRQCRVNHANAQSRARKKGEQCR